MTRSLYLCRADSDVCLESLGQAALKSLDTGSAAERFDPLVARANRDWQGATISEFVDDPSLAMATIVERFFEREEASKRSLVLGATHPELGALELNWNLRIAANLGTPVIIAISATDDAPMQSLARLAVAEAKRSHATVAGIIVVSKMTSPSTRIMEALNALDVPVVMASSGPSPSSQIVTAHGDLAELLDDLNDGAILVLDAEDIESIVGVALGVASGQGQAPGAVVVAGADRMDAGVEELWSKTLPMVELQRTHRPKSEVLSALSRQADCRVDLDRLLPAAESYGPVALTPVRFQQMIMSRARDAQRHIVLPEGDDDRILQAADRLLADGICRLTILGDPDDIARRAESMGLNLGQASLVDPIHSPAFDKYSRRYAELRAKKGMTFEQARERLTDVSYFGTLMVFEGDADGMVSGASHTTARTIRPSFETIKTKPGVSVVSSVFLMCLADHVLVFGDCAVNPNPTPEQIAEIAISSAQTAVQFGIEPRIALLSYSTGASGTGPDVDATVEATELLRQKAPELIIDGPLQYDAAVADSVGRKKMPGSPVAGRATVMIFPDLKSGNIAYKAVQRSAGALALGPILQGLNKPVNDLSRGALVDDIINTVAITAIQAQATP